MRFLAPRVWQVWAARRYRLKEAGRSGAWGREGSALGGPWPGRPSPVGLGFLTVSRRLQEVGRMKIELFADVVPKTAENFR